MSGKTISQSETRLEALKIQSSAYGVVIAMMWGVNRLAGNMLWYGGFKAIPQASSQGGKGGTRQASSTYTYAASVMMALGHGRIADIPRAWKGKKVYSGGITPSQVLTATETYSVPGAGAMTYTVTNAATFAGHMLATAAVGVGIDAYDRVLELGADFTLANGVYTLLNDTLRGLTVSFQYQWISGAYTQAALQQLGLTFIPGEIGQAAWSGLASFGAQSIGYSGLAAVAGVDYDLGSSASVENHTFEVVGPGAYHLGSTVPDVDPAVMLRDLLSNARAGANFPGEYLDDWDQFSNYCVANGLLVSPVLTTQASAREIVERAAELTNAVPVWSSRRLKILPRSDAAATGNGRTYTPAVTPVYALDDDCYAPPEGTPPLRMVRRRPADRFNHARVEYQDRAQQYNTAIADARDLADIEARGLRSRDIVDAKGWLADSTAARRAAQLLMQRSLHVGADFEFHLPWHYARLEPGDIVTLTDSGLGLAAVGAMITAIDESEDGRLQVRAEEYPAGSNAAPAYPAATSTGYQHDYNAAPGNAGTPVIFEVPAELSSTGLGVFVAVPAGASANWGGAQVWASLDGTNYRLLGVAYGGARVGALNGAAAAGASTIAVDGLGTQQLLSGSAADLSALNTLCYIGGANPEYFAYQTATLTGTGAYTLSTLLHGAYGTPMNAHADNDTFVRVDDRVLRSEDLEASMVGKTLYIKVCSFNLYGGAQQGLADVSAATYVVTGALQAYRSSTPRGNLVDATLWVNGTSGSQGISGGNRFLEAAPAGTNTIVVGSTPDGALRSLWQGTSTGTSSYTGWEVAAAQVPIKPYQVIRFSVWVRVTTMGGTPGTLYFGPASGGSAAAVTTGTPDSNPYFMTIARSALVVGRWYLLVGFVFPSASGTTQFNKGGLYDGATGQKVLDATDFKFTATATATGHRVLSWQASSGAVTQYWGPRVELCDGTEPSVSELLAMSLLTIGNTGALDFAQSIGLNGQFSLWAGTYPDGWALNQGANYISKETTLVRSGPNAVRMTPPGATEVNIYYLYAFGVPPPVGSYVRVACDLRVVTNTSGGTPHVVARLYTNVGLTTYRDTLLLPPALTTGVWQTVAANASVRPSETIYGLAIFLGGSWSGVPGGHWAGDVVFDSLVVDLMRPTDTDHLTTNAATDLDRHVGGSGGFTASATGDAVRIGGTATGGSGSGAILAYTNATGTTVRAQFEAVVIGLYSATAAHMPDAFWRYQINGGAFVNGGLFGGGGTAPDYTIPRNGFGVGDIQLAAGDVLSLELMAVNAATRTSNWAGHALRLSVIKR